MRKYARLLSEPGAGCGLLDGVGHADRHADLGQTGRDRHGSVRSGSPAASAHPVSIRVGGVLGVGDGLDLPEGHLGGLGQLGGQAAGIRHRLGAGLRHGGGLIGHVEGDAVDVVGARADGGVEQAAQLGEVAHGHVDGVIHRVGRAADHAGDLVVLGGRVYAEVAGLDILGGNAGVLQGIHQGLGLGVVVSDGGRNGGVFVVHADINVSDIGGQIDRAVAAHAQRARQGKSL